MTHPDPVVVQDSGVPAVEQESEEQQQEEGPPFSPLVGALFTQMHKDAAFTTNALIDGYKARIATLEAELAAIRSGVNDLLSHPWTPSTDAIRLAVFYPVIKR